MCLGHRHRTHRSYRSVHVFVDRAPSFTVINFQNLLLATFYRIHHTGESNQRICWPLPERCQSAMTILVPIATLGCCFRIHFVRQRNNDWQTNNSLMTMQLFVMWIHRWFGMECQLCERGVRVCRMDGKHGPAHVLQVHSMEHSNASTISSKPSVAIRGNPWQCMNYGVSSMQCIHGKVLIRISFTVAGEYC